MWHESRRDFWEELGTSKRRQGAGPVGEEGDESEQSEMVLSLKMFW